MGFIQWQDDFLPSWGKSAIFYCNREETRPVGKCFASKTDDEKGVEVI